MGLNDGQTLLHYRILSKLGEGGMGEVYLALDAKLGRQVALKLLPADMATDEWRRTRFEREARAVATLNHPNIVTIYAVEQVADLHFFTMEFVRGVPLSEAIPAGGFAPDRFFDLALPLTDAAGAAHRKGIVHRDLKPHNLALNEGAELMSSLLEANEDKIANLVARLPSLGKNPDDKRGTRFRIPPRWLPGLATSRTPRYGPCSVRSRQIPGTPAACGWSKSAFPALTPKKEVLTFPFRDASWVIVISPGESLPAA